MKKLTFIVATLFVFSLIACSTSDNEVILENPDTSANSIQNIRASFEENIILYANRNGLGADTHQAKKNTKNGSSKENRAPFYGYRNDGYRNDFEAYDAQARKNTRNGNSKENRSVYRRNGLGADAKGRKNTQKSN